jgi:hypothetical protein
MQWNGKWYRTGVRGDRGLGTAAFLDHLAKGEVFDMKRATAWEPVEGFAAAPPDDEPNLNTALDIVRNVAERESGGYDG